MKISHKIAYIETAIICPVVVTILSLGTYATVKFLDMINTHILAQVYISIIALLINITVATLVSSKLSSWLKITLEKRYQIIKEYN